MTPLLLRTVHMACRVTHAMGLGGDGGAGILSALSDLKQLLAKVSVPENEACIEEPSRKGKGKGETACLYCRRRGREGQRSGEDKQKSILENTPAGGNLSFIHHSFNKHGRVLPAAGRGESGGGGNRRTNSSGEYLSALSVPPPALPQNVYICKKKLRAVPHLRLLAEGQPLLARGRTFPSRMRNNIKTASVG